MGSSSRSYGKDTEHRSNILRVLRPEDLNGTNPDEISNGAEIVFLQLSIRTVWFRETASFAS